MSRQRKHIPLRRCVSCGVQLPQRELIRIVRTLAGPVVVDQEPRRQPGRGAYLCHATACWERTLKRDRLDHVLRSTVSLEDKERLKEFAESQLQRV